MTHHRTTHNRQPRRPTDEPGDRHTGERGAGSTRRVAGAAAVRQSDAGQVAGAPSTLEARRLLALQRLAGNSATKLTIAGHRDLSPSPRVLSRSPPMIRRVGEAKTDVVPVESTDVTVKQGVDLLKSVLIKVHGMQKSAKDDLWSKEIEPKAGKGVQGFSSTREYAAGLNRFSKFEQLQKEDEFTTGKLRLSPKPPTPPEYVYYVIDREGKPFSTLVATFAKRQYDPVDAREQTIGRPLYQNPLTKKDYVKDDLQVPTRRYAWVEKNYHQFMELMISRGLEGRFQRFFKAAAPAGTVRPDPHRATDEKATSVIPAPVGPDALLTDAQLAYLHQWQGSGMQQRGLSLTSTPRLGETIGNAGENFRTDDGVRIKIDLARIPPRTALLLNHYAEGGVKDSLGGVRQGVARNKNPYQYQESVTKNRELYLEYLDPAWIVEIEIHRAKGDRPPTGSGPPVEGQSSVFGSIDAPAVQAPLVWYREGFEQQLRARGKLDGAGDFLKGAEAALEYSQGYAQGERVRSTKPGVTPPADPLTWPELKRYDKKFDIWKIGFVHGRTGRRPPTTVSDVYA